MKPARMNPIHAPPVLATDKYIIVTTFPVPPFLWSSASNTHSISME